MGWINNKEQLSEWLYSRSVNDTFAVQYGDKLERTEYVTVLEEPYKERKNYYNSGLGEPYDIILKVGLRKDPSSDYVDDCSISHNPETNELFVKKGVGRFESIYAICKNALDVDYQSGRSLVAECGECGTQTEIQVKDDGNIQSSKMKRIDGSLVVPCCFTDNWNTKVE